MQQQTKLGICVLNWNAGCILVDCVRGLVAASESIRFELVVVDNNSSDNSIELLAHAYPRVQIQRATTNLGYARGNNLGAQHLLSLDCTALLFRNPDVIITAEVLSSLLSTLEGNPKIGCVGGVPIAGESVSKVACRSKPSMRELLILYGPLGRLAPDSWRRQHFLDLRGLKDGQFIYAVAGACVLVKRDAFEAVAGFDQHTFLYFEEFILAERLTQLGWYTAVSTAARYSHIGALSTDLIPYRRRLHFIDSEQYYLRVYRKATATVRAIWLFYRYAEWFPQAVVARLRSLRRRRESAFPRLETVK